MDYQMFSVEGNEDVGQIVQSSIDQRLTWQETYNLLIKLAQQPDRGEALDTAVREVVYWAIGAEKRDESFWV